MTQIETIKKYFNIKTINIMMKYMFKERYKNEKGKLFIVNCFSGFNLFLQL